eukprot:Skav232916  [mRNA]  locus=scaffold1477:688313:691673:- [translate_table: standard]
MTSKMFNQRAQALHRNLMTGSSNNAAVDVETLRKAVKRMVKFSDIRDAFHRTR